MNNMTDLVVKSNKLVQALQTLSLSETRLLQLAIVDARETGQGLSTDEPLELNALRYAKAFNVSADAARMARWLKADEKIDIATIGINEFLDILSNYSSFDEMISGELDVA